MSAPRTALSVLDLAPVVSGQDATRALANSLDLAAEVDTLGYRRIWFAEHHLTPGTASAAPAVLAALAAERTARIRVGTGAVLLAHTSAVTALEQLATVARLHPGRVDLGLGRAAVGPPSGARTGGEPGATGAAPTPPPDPPAAADELIAGVVVPRPPRFRLTDPEVRDALGARQAVVGARSGVPPFGEELRRALELLTTGTTVVDGHSYPSPLTSGADLEIWPLASSGGESARVAGQLGLPLVANYHVAPAAVLETVHAYRAAFVPGVLTEPYVAVSVDAVVAPTDEEARRLAAGYGHFVLSVRDLSGAEPYRSAEEAAARPLTDAERELVHDRLVTQVVGDPDTVTARLAALADLTGAAELIVTTITHDHADRLRSYRLLADAWGLTPEPRPSERHLASAATS